MCSKRFLFFSLLLFCLLVLVCYCSNVGSEEVLWLHWLVIQDHAFSSWKWNGSVCFFQVPKVLELSVIQEWILLALPLSTRSCHFTKPCIHVVHNFSRWHPCNSWFSAYFCGIPAWAYPFLKVLRICQWKAVCTECWHSQGGRSEGSRV